MALRVESKLSTFEVPCKMLYQASGCSAKSQTSRRSYTSKKDCSAAANKKDAVPTKWKEKNEKHEKQSEIKGKTKKESQSRVEMY